MIWMDVDAALSEVPVNILPLLDDTDFKTRETGVAFNAAGMDLVWNFVTSAGAFTQTAVTPTSGGSYDWAHQGDGMYTIEIPASGGASINNDTEGFGWFSGIATGVLPWRGPIIGFRAAGLNDKLIESAYETTRGLAGTALPNAAADAAGGLPISDAGGLDLDTLLARLDANISTRSSHSAADVWAVATRVLTAGTNIVLAKGTGITGFNDLNASAVANAVWDEAKAGHVGAGSFGEEVQAHALSADIPSAASIADAVWDEAKSGHVDSGSFGEEIQAHALSSELFTATEIADAVLGRNIAGGSDGGRTVTSALRKLRNRVAISGGTMTVYEEDDSTPDHTEAVTTAAGDPITETDPS